MDNKENQIKKSRLATVAGAVVAIVGFGEVTQTNEAEAQIFRNRATVVQRQAVTPVISPSAVPFISKNTPTRADIAADNLLADLRWRKQLNDGSPHRSGRVVPHVPATLSTDIHDNTPDPVVFIKNDGMNVVPSAGVNIWNPYGAEPGIRRLENWEPTLTIEQHRERLANGAMQK